MSANIVSEQQSLVRERLELVYLITSLNPQFLNPKLIRDTLDDGWTHPWQYFDALRNYLLLTCFDILGQPHDFMDFQSWLSASSTENERTVALLKANDKKSLQDAVKVVHREYLTLYGTKNSFYRFVQNVLPESVRSELLYSVTITKFDPERNNLGIGTIEAASEKIAFLYTVRNSFTHAGIGIGSPAGGVWKDFGKRVDENGKVLKGWEPIHNVFKGGLGYQYAVRDWPDVLIRVIKAVLTPIPITAQPFYPPE